jgi:hypothetical protein
VKVYSKLGSVVIIVLAFSAGCKSPRANAPRHASAASQACIVDTVVREGELGDARISRAVREYSGNYSTADSLTIFVTDLRAGERARAALQSEIRSLWPQAVVPNASFVRVKYSYRQLQSWLECLSNRSQPTDGHGGDGWVRAGVAPRQNAVRIDVIGENIRVSLERLVAQLGIPREAVVVTVLRRDEARPPAG